MELYSIFRGIFLVGSIITILILSNRCKKRAIAIICGFAILIGATALDLHFPFENDFVHLQLHSRHSPITITGKYSMLLMEKTLH